MSTVPMPMPRESDRSASDTQRSIPETQGEGGGRGGGAGGSKGGSGGGRGRWGPSPDQVVEAYRLTIEDGRPLETLTGYDAPDIDLDVALFGMDYRALLDLGVEYPVFVTGDQIVPIALSLPDRQVRWRSMEDDEAAIVRDRIVEGIGEPIEHAEVLLVHPPHAARSLLRAIRDAIVVRLKGDGRDPALPYGPPGRAPFKVFTDSDGLEVVCSPYYLHRTDGFGFPSSPVEGWLKPSLYRFGAKGKGFENTRYSVPPDQVGHLSY